MRHAPRHKRVLAALALVVALPLSSCSHHQDTTQAASPEAIELQARQRPDDPAAQLRYGEMLTDAKRYEEAAPVLDHARELAPNDARPYALLGVVAAAEHRAGDAYNLFHDALKRDSTNITAIRELGNLHAQAHHQGPAIRAFERLTQLRPNDADAWQRLGLLLMGAGENYRSLDALARSAALNPADLLTQDAVGNMALQAGRLDQAERAFRTVLAKEPNNPQAHIGLSQVIMRQNPSPEGLKAAEQEADAALQARESAPAYRARALARMTMRRFDDAIKDINAALLLEPDNRDLYVLLSQCYASAGKPELARKASAEFERRRMEQLARDRAAGRQAEAMK